MLKQKCHQKQNFRDIKFQKQASIGSNINLIFAFFSYSWRRALLGLQLPSGPGSRQRNLLPMWS